MPEAPPEVESPITGVPAESATPAAHSALAAGVYERRSREYAPPVPVVGPN
nr:hypothetical protein [Deltaproteobacteria bacterium]